ncbi:hypothetical protein TNCV_2062891 [Trichonephila clavipes]|nr:hypothetical protein TNCV_2062891 [Trichonephila clavipes]
MSPSLNTRKDDMILLRQASPIVNGVLALLYHYDDPSGCRHSPSSDNKQWPHGHVHWSFYSLKIQGQSMGLSGYGHELVAGVSRARALLTLKACRVDEVIPPAGVVVRKEGLQLRCPPRHSTKAQNYKVCDQ